MVKLKPIESQERMYVRVARRISELVRSGEVKPGDRLPSERDLAEMLKVSRPSVREAMIALEVSGVLEVRTGAGIYVSENVSPSGSDIADEGIGPFEILEMRLLLEPEACALAAERIIKEQLAQLRHLYHELERTNGTPEMEAYDEQFHNLISEASQNTAISKSIAWLWRLRGQSELSRGYHRLIVGEGVYPVLDEHAAILSALESRDSKTAREAMRAHLEAATQSAAAHFAEGD
ncbi:MAG: FadR/GntR family transcriptional regulator [Pseudohongiellaceae bacterium]